MVRQQKADPIFKLIDLDEWPRKLYFEHYSQHVKCTFSITADVDISNLLAVCKKQSVKLYPAMIYIISRAVNDIEELCINYDDEKKLRLWNFVSPSYTVFHDEDKTFSTIWTPFHLSFATFHKNYLEDTKSYGNNKSFLAKPDEPENTFPISCIPWVDFTGFNLNIYGKEDYLSPIFTMGKYGVKENKTLIPVAAQLHHALCDGYHVGILFESIRKLALNPQEWISS